MKHKITERTLITVKSVTSNLHFCNKCSIIYNEVNLRSRIVFKCHVVGNLLNLPKIIVNNGRRRI